MNPYLAPRSGIRTAELTAYTETVKAAVEDNRQRPRREKQREAMWRAMEKRAGVK